MHWKTLQKKEDNDNDNDYETTKVILQWNQLIYILSKPFLRQFLSYKTSFLVFNNSYNNNNNEHEE